MSSWSDQFASGAILESTDGATYNQIKEIVDPNASNTNYEENAASNVPSLAEQLAARKAEEEEEYRQNHRNLPPKALDEEEVFFLEAIQREEQIKEDLKRKQEQKDVDSFNNALKNRVIKLKENNQIIPINMQINSNKDDQNENDKKSKDKLVMAPSVHNDDKPKVNLDGVVLLKKLKKKKNKKKKKKKKDKEKMNGNSKKRKLNEIDIEETTKSKRRKLDINNDSKNENKLSEWERD